MMKSWKSLKAVIFDMEGVLIYSQPFFWKARRQYLKQFGIEHDKKFVKSMRGMSLKDQLKLIEERYNIKIDYADFSKKTGKTQWELMEGKDFENLPARKLISELKNRRMKVGLSSHNIRKNIRKGLQVTKLEGLFDAVVTIEDMVMHKPHPEGLLLAAKLLHVRPEDCLVIEDSPKGIQSAIKCGMRAIGIKHDFNDEKDLIEAGAEKIFNSLEEISLENI